MAIAPRAVLPVIAVIGIGAAIALFPGSPTKPSTETAAAAATAPRFEPAALAAMKRQLLAEPAILDVMHQDTPVEWQVAVKPDGSARVGYARYVCQLLAEKKLVDAQTDVRVVDVVKLDRVPGDFRGASLGHVKCSTGESMGI